MHVKSAKSNLYDFFFHPFQFQEKSINALSICTNIFLSIVTLGLWQVPFWIINKLDSKKISHFNKSRYLPPEVEIVATVAKGLLSSFKSILFQKISDVIHRLFHIKYKDKNKLLNTSQKTTLSEHAWTLNKALLKDAYVRT